MKQFCRFPISKIHVKIDNHTYTLYDRNKRNKHALQRCVYRSCIVTRATFTHLRYQFFTFLRNIIILLHVNATHVIHVFVYLLSLQSHKLSYPAPSVYHYLYLNKKNLPERTRSLILFMCKSACQSYKHMYHLHLYNVHFYSNNLLYNLSYTIFLNDNKIATCIYPK